LALLEKAEILLEKAISLEPNNIDCLTNLIAIYNQRQKPKLALEKIKLAINISSLNPKLYSLLGAVFVKLGQIELAKNAFSFANKIDPLFLEPLMNLASLMAIEGDSEISIRLYEELLRKNVVNSLNSLPSEPIKYNLSIEYLKIGELKKGWELYEFGFHPNVQAEYKRAPSRTFDVPIWDGRKILSNQALLVWAEQGVGDELLFMSCLPELEFLSGTVIIECDARIISLVTRSFPKFIVRATSIIFDYKQSPIYHDYDFHIPLGSLMKFYRNNIEDFEKSKSYIKINKIKADEFENNISLKNSTSLRIGISWRSGKLSAERNISYTSLLDWGEIFAIENLSFYNLQYGECEEELIIAESKFNIIINRWNNLDLKNDFDSTIALMSRLDIIITIESAVCQMAGSIGMPVILMAPRGYAHLGTDYYPFAPNTTCLFPPKGGITSECIKDVAQILLNLNESKSKASS
jgi:tetratricopeptide (TPR) repeat protein